MVSCFTIFSCMSLPVLLDHCNLVSWCFCLFVHFLCTGLCVFNKIFMLLIKKRKKRKKEKKKWGLILFYIQLWFFPWLFVLFISRLDPLICAIHTRTHLLDAVSSIFTPMVSLRFVRFIQVSMGQLQLTQSSKFCILLGIIGVKGLQVQSGRKLL